jgi:ribosomal-protein-alanine N-acetyltransferase
LPDVPGVLVEPMLSLAFHPFPELRTERLRLRQLTLSDAGEIFLLRSNERVNKYLDRPSAQSIDDAIAFINKIDQGIANNESLYWVITMKDESKLIGTISLWNISREDSKAEIGYELMPEYHGKGFMQEAFARTIKYIGEVLKVETIEAWTHSKNLASSKILERNGFKRDHAAEAKNKEDLGESIIYQLRSSAVSITPKT